MGDMVVVTFGDRPKVRFRWFHRSEFGRFPFEFGIHCVTRLPAHCVIPSPQWLQVNLPNFHGCHFRVTSKRFLATLHGREVAF